MEGRRGPGGRQRRAATRIRVEDRRSVGRDGEPARHRPAVPPRMSPAPELNAGPFLTARWQHLAILNYEVPRELVAPSVPAGTELDDYNGLTLASVVGFRFLDTRVLGMAIPGHRNFEEVNLRFYVRRLQPDGTWRRAVVFIKELVPRLAVAVLARWCYHEPYSAVPMAHELTLQGSNDGAPGRAEYRWKVGSRWHRLAVRKSGRPS